MMTIVTHITLKEGTYRTLCPNGTTAPEGKLVVTG